MVAIITKIASWKQWKQHTESIDWFLHDTMSHQMEIFNKLKIIFLDFL